MAPKIKRPLLMSREEFDALFGETLSSIANERLAAVLMHMRDVAGERIGDRRASRRPRDESKDARKVRLAAKKASREEKNVQYKAYLSSPLWETIRTRVLQRDNGLCLCCGRKASQVHHRSYSPAVMSGQNITLLASICRQCHDTIHSGEDGARCSPRQTEMKFLHLVKCFEESKSIVHGVNVDGLA